MRQWWPSYKFKSSCIQREGVSTSVLHIKKKIIDFASILNKNSIIEFGNSKIEKNFMCSIVLFNLNQIKGNKMELSLKRLFTIGVYIMCVFIVCEIDKISAQRTILDKFINEYRSFRGGLFKFVGRSDTESAYLWNLKRQVTTTIKMMIDHYTSFKMKRKKKIHQILLGFDIPW